MMHYLIVGYLTVLLIEDDDDEDGVDVAFERRFAVASVHCNF